MHVLIPGAIVLVIAFLIGSLPTGFFVGCFYGKDLRSHGSKNIGTTNAFRTLGKKAGIFTFIGDVLKGVLAVCLAYWPGLFNAQVLDPSTFAPLLGFAAVLGHCFSPFLRFKGGKGVATGFGVFLVLAFVPAIIATVAFAVMLKLSGYVSLGSLSAAVVLLAGIALNIGGPYGTVLLLATICTSALIIIRHSANIRRLIEGKELAVLNKKSPEEVKSP